MKTIKIGADELILWLRKNKIHKEVNNKVLGKAINDIMESLDGTTEPEDYNVKVRWPIHDSKKVNKKNLPKTAAQYTIDINKLKDVYIKLEKIKFP